MDTIEKYVLEPTDEFINDSRRFVTKCNKPDAKGLLENIQYQVENGRNNM